MWVRKCDIDAGQDAGPIPTRVVSNEEFVPPPPSPELIEVEARLKALSDEEARRQGVDRRTFLRSGSGMAASLVVLNQVFGRCYEVGADEVKDPKA
ncbi:MAG: hypothetical protein ACRC33_29510, partial [Gemmataceae bacterium]